MKYSGISPGMRFALEPPILYLSIKFIHEVSPSKINFLDVTVLLHDNSIATDLLNRLTPISVKLILSPQPHKKSTPHSLALKIHRICSINDNFKQCTNELLEFLCQRGHKETTSKHKSTKLSMFHVQHSLLPTQEIQQLYSICHYLQPTQVNYCRGEIFHAYGDIAGHCGRFGAKSDWLNLRAPMYRCRA